MRERKEPTNTAAISAMLTAITTLGLVGLGIMLMGAVILRRKANLDQELIGVFMMFVFLIVSVTEFMLVRNLSKLTSSNEREKYFPPPPTTNELRLPAASPLGEPIPSVTENTTRTLEYERRH
ncbi:MAG TPA: hypothetical protein VFY51_05225 [Pyrinomonadaceae bacterium]|nr:hypothetical protein [Pyrinomonadaceae bacterium]